MNIDLLLSQNGQMGLVADALFKSAVAGVMFDTLTGILSLEFADTDSLEMNIPVEETFGRHLTQQLQIHVGVIVNDVVADNRQVPVLLFDDPFGGAHDGTFAMRPGRSVMAFESFLRRCASGQPLHRDDLGDEKSAGGVMGGLNPAVLQFSPQLARQRAMEAAPKAAPQIAPSAPGFGPKGMGGGGMGGGGMSGGNRGTTIPPQRPPQRRDDDE